MSRLNENAKSVIEEQLDSIKFNLTSVFAGLLYSARLEIEQAGVSCDIDTLINIIVDTSEPDGCVAKWAIDEQCGSKTTMAEKKEAQRIIDALAGTLNKHGIQQSWNYRSDGKPCCFCSDNHGVEIANTGTTMHRQCLHNASLGNMEKALFPENDELSNDEKEFLSPKAKRAIKKYGREICEKAYHLNEIEGNGPRTIADELHLGHTNAADSAIDAGRELNSGILKLLTS